MAVGYPAAPPGRVKAFPGHRKFWPCQHPGPRCKVRWAKGIRTMEIMEYKTAVSTDIASLDKIVNELIEKGFQPFGSPYFVPKNAHGVVIDYTVCQAMVS